MIGTFLQQLYEFRVGQKNRSGWNILFESNACPDLSRAHKNFNPQYNNIFS
jgi:hypothetical protein